jgi:YegS/Rv2252/BmrU family lipid kinase
MTDLAASAAAPTGRHLLVIFNPTAGGRRRRRLKAVLQALERSGCRVTLRRTGARGDAEAFARAAGATEPPVDLVVAAGGDGTINEVINGLAAPAAAAPPPLALLPIGTANVLANEIGLPSAPDAIAREIAAGRVQPMPLARANGRCFAMMAGVGFDAHVVADLDTRLKRRLGKGAYVVESVRQLFRFGFPRYRVTIDGAAFEAGSVIVARGRFYGGRYVCAPEARLGAAELHVCLFERGGRLAVPLFGAALVLGLLPRLPGYRVVRGRRVTIEGPPGDPVQGDGDIIARLPVTIGLDPQALALVVPGV